MKKKGFIIINRKLLACFAIMFFLNDCGTLGGWTDVCFTVSPKKLESGIDNLFLRHPEYKIPAKWNELNDWSQRGYDFLKSWVFYLKSSPEEMYYVTIVANPANDVEPETTIAIRSINRGKTWLNYDQVSESERKRIQDRFDREIVSKLENELNAKAVKKNRY